MWRYGAMALVALTFSNENILFLEKYQHIHHDSINYIDPGPCHGLVIKQKKVETKSKLSFPLIFICDSDRIQTCNLLIRSQMLYSVELRSLHFRIASAKVTTFFETTKTFSCFFEKSYF